MLFILILVADAPRERKQVQKHHATKLVVVVVVVVKSLIAY